MKSIKFNADYNKQIALFMVLPKYYLAVTTK